MELIDKILSIIAPYECLGCGVEGAIICEACTSALLVPAYSACAGCGKVTNNFSICKNCKPRMPLENIWVAYDYNKTAKKIVNAYKYNSNVAVALFMGGSMNSVLPHFDCVITNAPSAPNRVRRRGFDHALKLAKCVSTKARLPYQKLLYRTASTRQVGSTKNERFLQAKGMYFALKPEDIKGKNILVIDDVVTTGATISAIARELKSHGVKNVYGLVFAKKM